MKERASWRAWEVFLSALFGLPFDGEDAAALYARHTGRTRASLRPAREAWVVVGRRGGKSRIAALISLYLACFRDYRSTFAPGEVGTLPIIAADRQQARTVMRYITGFLDEIPMLRRMVASQTKDSIKFTNRVVIEVHTANFRAIRGYSIIGAVCDEIAFWPTDEAGANPDTEILNGLRPGMATVPDALLVAISSPYARQGALWEAYRHHYGQEEDPVLVWQADTRSMNPVVDPQLIANAYAADEVAAAAEYGAEFRRDIERFVSREAVERVGVSDRRELPFRPDVTYRAFIDPSGGSHDSMTLAIAHREEDKDRIILDCIRERRAPFNPSEVVREFANLLRAYGITDVLGDRYAGEWPRERFQAHGISYVEAPKTKTDYYLGLLPLVNSARIELLDESRLIGQLSTLERRTTRSGRDLVDHPTGAHDDLINAVAGALVTAAESPTHLVLDLVSRPMGSYPQQLADGLPLECEPPCPDLTCGWCAHRVLRDGKPFCGLRLFGIEDADVACEMFDAA